MQKLLIILSAAGLLNITACSNTVSGMGKDIEKAGESIKKTVINMEKKFEDKD